MIFNPVDNDLKKIAFFDFCETIVSIQSTDIFIDFICNKIKPNKKNYYEVIRILILRNKIISFFIKKNRNLISKKLKLRQLSGIKKNDIDRLSFDFYNSILKKKIITSIISEIKNKKNDGYDIYIVSGGYYEYIKYFALDFNLNPDNLITTDIFYSKNGVCKGKIKGYDCMKENKIKKIKSKIKKLNNYDLKNSYAYSDSITDLPLLKFVGNGVVINKKVQQWAKENNLKQLIWKD